MKIKNIKVNAYGNIENKDINLEEGINIIHGANESGKSTLLNYIISIFYGISRNKDGKALSDYEKYKPWNSNEFSGRISYKLENGEKYEIFRDFNKKNPKIYNDKLEDISDRFETDKKDGSKFFIEQMGIDKQMYLSTVVSTQEEVRLDEKNQNMLIQKIANLAGTGEDNVSYKKALIKLQEKIRDEIGTNKTSQKPINIIEKEIVEINNKIVETEKYRNRKYEIDAEKEQILSELKELEQQKQILQELQNSMKSEEETKNRLEIREKNRKDNIAKINELTNQKNTINAESERVQSAKNHLQDIIKGHKENIEKLNSEIEKIANEKEETQEKEKPSISFIVITVVLAIALICSIILIKNYIVSGILEVAIIANIVFYVINKNKQKVNKAKLREKINQEKQYKREKLENQKQQIIANVNTTEKELEKQEEEEKQVNSELSMLKGQIILLEKNNEKITEEIEQDNKVIKEESNKNKQQIIEKYKDKNINDLLYINDYRNYISKIEETINNNRIRIKGLEIEYNTIVPQLDEMVVLEEKREADKEKLAELREKESIINIAIENLMDAYEEMKTTITPKFTKNLSESIQKISSNKYNKVTINDENGMIIENNRGEYVEAIKLSTGTIDQLYLAFRLSMIDELSKENLPIILDESFAYSDNNRLKNMLQYLTSDLNNHQTIIFTCTDREQKMLEAMNIPYNVVEL
ncbi:MAG: ATP-binding protein [Clostridia bacterium]